MDTGLPKAPPVTTTADPADGPVPPELRTVFVLLFTNLGLSVVLTVLVFVLRDSLVDYQLAHAVLPPGTDVERFRSVLHQQVWFRVAGVLLVSAMYLRVGYRLRRGHRAAYRRVVWISIGGLLGLLSLLLSDSYPWWMRVEQIAQGAVLAALLWFVTRPAMRARFAKEKKLKNGFLR